MTEETICLGTTGPIGLTNFETTGPIGLTNFGTTGPIGLTNFRTTGLIGLTNFGTTGPITNFERCIICQKNTQTTLHRVRTVTALGVAIEKRQERLETKVSVMTPSSAV